MTEPVVFETISATELLKMPRISLTIAQIFQRHLGYWICRGRPPLSCYLQLQGLAGGYPFFKLGSLKSGASEIY